MNSTAKKKKVREVNHRTHRGKYKVQFCGFLDNQVKKIHDLTNSVKLLI